jgi:3-oxoacyl-[acyl-carrier-protein] synthase-3
VSRPTVALLGAGHAVPERVRGNDDPLFARVRRDAADRGVPEHTLFVGNRERRVLGPGESLVGLVAAASRGALVRAGACPGEIDRLYGYLSVSEHLAPNSLFAVHRELGLGAECMVVPVNTEFTNWLTGAVLAWEAVLAEHAERCLVACGAAWTGSMDYTQGHSVSIGDGAGAAVVGPGERMVLVDYAVDTLSAEYGAMSMSWRPGSGADHPTYAIHPDAGVKAFLTTGMDGPPRLVDRLLRRHGLSGGDVSLVAHQASRKLMDHWAERIRPAAYLDTFEQWGNLTLASAPATLSAYWDCIRTPWLVIVGVGIGAHQTALLVRV